MPKKASGVGPNPAVLNAATAPVASIANQSNSPPGIRPCSAQS
ncbi:MAG TPA: hypothetical protein VEA69_11555 [Tepidisphaeraceae bacterium]|nr:hypothetical protein [Tepidisphaeraceae bacterium]